MELGQIIKDLSENKIVVQPVNSSNISTIGYNPNNKKLIILFKRGTIYRYENVNLETFFKMILAESVGKAFHEYINNKYTFTRLDKDGSNRYRKIY